MKKKFLRVLSLLVCLTLVFSVFSSAVIVPSAKTAAEWQKEIDRLKKQQKSDKLVLDAIRGKINAVNAEIMAYNRKIESINADISANNAQIKKDKEEIESDKLEFKKRIRSIGMSGTESNVRILLGASTFSQFLQLSQLTSSVSSHDKRLMEDLVKRIDELNAKNEENTKLADEQKALRDKIAVQQADLKKQEAAAAKIYNADTSNVSNAEAQWRAAKAAEESKAYSGSANTPSFVNSDKVFLWPVALGSAYVSAGYQSNDSVHKGTHNGIDIAGGGISGTPIRAIASGYVKYVNNTCKHNYKKSGSCGCGGGYGNYCIIDHGVMNVGQGSFNYSAWYAHAASIIVSPGQWVARGQTIGYVGTTGWSTGYHLHLGIKRGPTYQNSNWINPSTLSYQK